MKLTVLCLLPLACATTPADHTHNIRTVVNAATVECKLYLTIKSLPRDPLLDQRCPALVVP